ncbi:hypothetical protein BH10BAC4_BH10BAC4_17840 [soil metagenome]
MKHFLTIIKGDYLQRTRSYAFLVTLAIALYLAYTFVPPVDANYTTVRIGNYLGDYNSAWIGHVTAMMTSVFLALIGFFLINNSVKKDIETEVGMIIATTRISNFNYLLSKVLSNFLVLLSIVGIVLFMSIIVFFLRSKDFPFEISQFLLPYAVVTLPNMFLVSCLAVVAEVFLGRRSVIQYILFFALFNIVIANVQPKRGTEMLTYLDPFGVKIVTMKMEDFVRTRYGDEVRVMSMGFNFGDKKEIKMFVFEGIQWPFLFILSRLAWMAFGVTLVWGGSRYFHRFDVKARIREKKKPKVLENISSREVAKELKISSLPPMTVDYSILPFIKTEVLMLIRKGPRWFWIINLGSMVALLFTPLTIAHQFLLPILWFLQVVRLSDLVTKEKTNLVHYFTYAAYQPLKRLLPSQIMAGISLMIVLSVPLLLRYTITSQWLPIGGIIAGAIFIVLLSTFLGIVSGGKKLFEILFFAITYANVNRVPFCDYFGATWTSAQPLGILLILIVGFTGISWLVRDYEIKHA